MLFEQEQFGSSDTCHRACARLPDKSLSQLSAAGEPRATRTSAGPPGTCVGSNAGAGNSDGLANTADHPAKAYHIFLIA